MTATIGDLFLERPEQWGMRGDPYLWDEMADALALEPLPASDTVLLVKLADAFRESTGVSLGDSCEMVEVERFRHGGMSSGFVHLEFWLETALPLLIRRAVRLRAHDAAQD